MAKAFFYLRKSTGKQPQLIYVGLRTGDDQLAVSTGIKVNPKRWDSKKGEIRQSATPFEVQLPVLLGERCRIKNLDVISFTNNYLQSIADFVNQKSGIPKDLLTGEIKSFVNGRSELEQYAFDLDCFVKGLVAREGMTKEKLITAIDSYLHPATDKITLLDYIDKVVTDSTTGRRMKDGQILNPRTIQRYNTTKQLLQDFQKVYSRNIDFDTIDLDFYKDLNAYMVNVKDYKPATLGKHVSTLKTFLREATEEGINTNLKYQSKAFKAVEDDSDSIYLTEQELAAMYALDLSAEPRLDKVRDLFLIGANTGLRFSDFTTIKAHNLKKVTNGYNLEVIQYKTKEKVVIPVNDTVMAILSKYKNVLPEPISNQKFNDYIKEIAQRVPALQALETKVFVKGGKEVEETCAKWELVTTHTARRSFSSNAYLSGKPTLAIMAITGHQTEKSFMRYIKTSKNEHAELMRKHGK
ncbi:tyrosine-type recombinase/integrase [Runella sp. CRIBMP]|uniref:site-specific integrase n=1 Tax=Runella sp. CRIBMP TaxID=2683261 RepID=UPI0014123EF6|nr:site-specific integrase [Runella sp. CRIBMP]NBB22792.1 tyrosine-type recombinase/integrase [Runella sp. CRIBMP]